MNISLILLKLVLGFFKLTPFWLLYRISDGLFLIIYHVVRLRRHVIRRNLRFAFPDYSTQQLRKIEKDTLRNFCDVILETAKGYTMTPEEMSKRYIISNPEMIDPYHADKRSVIAFVGHYNNWEWGICLQKYLKHQAFYIYKKLHNRTIDEFVRKNREIHGGKLVDKAGMARTLLRNRRKPCFYVLIADQRPSGDQDQRTVKFLNHDVPCFAGPEQMAKTFNFPVVYCKIERIKRGYYKTEGIMICENPKESDEGDITQRCMAELEKQIYDDPANWMWLHKRFKGIMNRSVKAKNEKTDNLKPLVDD